VERRIAGDDVTLLINNAGMALRGGLLDHTPDDLTRIVTLNCIALVRLAAAGGKCFAQRGSGAIINIGSVLSLVNHPGFGGGSNS
jgi:uncharacterized protein